jgi:hypothetical protein
MMKTLGLFEKAAGAACFSDADPAAGERHRHAPMAAVLNAMSHRFVSFRARVIEAKSPEGRCFLILTVSVVAGHEKEKHFTARKYSLIPSTICLLIYAHMTILSSFGFHVGGGQYETVGSEDDR